MKYARRAHEKLAQDFLLAPHLMFLSNLTLYWDTTNGICEYLGENLILCKNKNQFSMAEVVFFTAIIRLLHRHRQLENNKQRKQFFFVDETAIVEMIVQLESYKVMHNL